MRITVIVLIATALAATGCSFSDSSESISKSISSPSRSSSRSSGGDDSGGSEKETAPPPESPQETSRYQRDVTQLTVTYLKSGGEISAYQSAVAGLAHDRGITDWEADATTTRAIGTGAASAGLDEERFESFSRQLVGDDPTKRDELRTGYQRSASTTSSSTADGDPSVDG